LVNGHAGAVEAELSVSALERSYDMDETALGKELEAERTSYLARIEALTGIPGVENKYNSLQKPEDQTNLRADADSHELKGLGELRPAYLAIQEPAAEYRLATEQFRQLDEKIADQDMRTNEIARIKNDRNEQIASLDFQVALAGLIPSVGITASADPGVTLT